VQSERREALYTLPKPPSSLILSKNTYEKNKSTLTIQTLITEKSNLLKGHSTALEGP